jgi:polyisoprenyl-phosphate glycosyltransferase
MRRKKIRFLADGSLDEFAAYRPKKTVGWEPAQRGFHGQEAPQVCTDPRKDGKAGQSGFVSVVVPAFNEAKNLPHLYERLRSVLESAGWRFELIVVDDGSTDTTLAVIKELRLRDPRVQYVSLSRNFGHQAALLAGLGRSQGNVVVSMDADLQHPPEMIPRMLTLWLEGYEVVHTSKRSDESASLFRRVIARLFYRIFSMVSDVQLVFGQSDFRLLDARVVSELCRIPEHDKFLRGLVGWMGFRQANLDYDVSPRFAGRPTYPLVRRVRFHINGILSFSIIPLRLFTLLGLLVSIPAGLYGLWALVAGIYGLMFGYPLWVIPGWGSIEASVTFLGGVQLIGIGMLGEYLGRVFEQTKGRPEYLVRETSLGITDQAAQRDEPAPIDGRQGIPLSAMDRADR